MIKAPNKLQDLRRRIYVKAKAEPTWRFWGLYTHVCKLETLREAYKMAKRNNGAPGIDGVTFEAIEEAGLETFLERLREELVSGKYQAMRNRRREIPKGGGKTRVLSIPAIRDRVVQGALKLILEPVFEADFQPGSYGYRPKRGAHEAVRRVTHAVNQYKHRVIDIDLRAYFDNIRHFILLEKVARRVDDKEVMRLLKMSLKATGKKGVPQGGVISPLLSNIYLNEVDKMLEKAKRVTSDKYTRIEYARYADDLVILVDAKAEKDWLLQGVGRRLREELSKIQVEVNEKKSRIVNMANGESFGFLGFEIRWIKGRRGKWWPLCTPQTDKRTALLRKLKEEFRRYTSQPAGRVIERINPILRGWVTYFATGNSGRTFNYIREWVEKKMRRHLMRAGKRGGFGWRRWSKTWLYESLGLFHDYRVVYGGSLSAVLST